MTDSPNDRPALLAGLIFALDVVADHVVLLDGRGRIVHANVAWQRFALDNGDTTTDWVGVDYVTASSEPCVRAGVPDPITDGVRAVLAGRRDAFECEYDCHAPDEMRWFRLTATRAALPGIAAVVAHSEITGRRAAEAALEHHATHDRITGSLNRPALEHHAAQLLAEGQRAAAIRIDLHDPARHPELLHDDDLRAAADIVRELFPGPARVGRWDHRSLLVVLSGVSGSALDEQHAVLESTLSAVLAPIESRTAALEISTDADLQAMGHAPQRPRAADGP